MIQVVPSCGLLELTVSEEQLSRGALYIAHAHSHAPYTQMSAAVSRPADSMRMLLTDKAVTAIASRSVKVMNAMLREQVARGAKK